MTVEPTVVETPVREQPLGAGSPGTCGDDDDGGDGDGDDYGEDNHSVPGNRKPVLNINGGVGDFYNLDLINFH